jgi:hypothetical protein
MPPAISVVVSTLALTISMVTAWLTLFRRGTVRMTRPTAIYFGADGSVDRSPKVYLRTVIRELLHMTQKTVGVLIVSGVLGLLVAPTMNAEHASQKTDDLSRIYETLQHETRLATDITVPEAERSKASAKLKVLRKQLASNEAGAVFTIDKLEEIDRSEVPAFVDDCKSAFTETAATNAPYKYQLIEALAEAYSQLPSDLQKRILQVLEDTYTPVVACNTSGGRTVIDWGLIHIGKDAIGVLIRLARSPMKSVRCGADDLLNEIARTPESTRQVRPAPILACESAERSSEQLERWYRWWQQNSSIVKFPILPEADPPL